MLTIQQINDWNIAYEFYASCRVLINQLRIEFLVILMWTNWGAIHGVRFIKQDEDIETVSTKVEAAASLRVHN